VARKVRAARCGDEAGIAQTHVESWRSTYAGIVPRSFLDGLSVEARQGTWRRQLCHPAPGYHAFVAESDAAAIVGFADCGPERGGNPLCDGELYAIYLLQQEQRRGTGRALVAAVTRALLDEGFHGMLLWVLEQNAVARPFYDRLGGAVLGSQRITIGGAELSEVAYGWPDLAALAAEIGSSAPQ
jgi:GNAT superfamily N-acetyltransferase